MPAFSPFVWGRFSGGIFGALFGTLVIAVAEFIEGGGGGGGELLSFPACAVVSSNVLSEELLYRLMLRKLLLMLDVSALWLPTRVRSP